jgi:general secretion pathway protein D
MGLQESITRIDDIIDRLDHKPPQVYLATVIGQLTLEDGFEFGVNYVREFMLNSDGTGGSGSFLTDGIAGGSIDDVQDNITNAIPAPNGLNLYGSFTGGLDVFINALESTDRFQVLSRPAVYAANNRKAVITSGQRIPVPTSSLTTTSDRNDTANIRTNIEFRDVVLKLEVIPLINADRDVTLQIAQVNDTVIGEQVVSGKASRSSGPKNSIPP